LNNVIHVLPDGTLVDTFSEIYTATDQLYTNLRLIRSTDHGATWSGPTTIAADSAMGVSDPESKVPVRDSSLMADVAEGPNGNLYVVWQDSRFSAYDHDGIAFSMSTDGGQTWSTPTEVNGAPDVQAFTPSVSVRADGTIGVTYYDFRYNDAAASLPTAYWLTESTDGIHWSEKRIAGPFDLTYAPRVDDSTLASQNPPEFFLGDYQGLAAQGSSFLPFFVKTNSGNTANRTDVWARPGASVTRTVQAFHVARAAPAVAIDANARARLSANAARALRSRAHHIAIPEQP
jgi:hypothetical protein